MLLYVDWYLQESCLVLLEADCLTATRIQSWQHCLLLVVLHLQWDLQLRNQARYTFLQIFFFLLPLTLSVILVIKLIHVVFSLQGVLTDILKCLGDNKKNMRECTLSTLDSWVVAVHLDKMVTTLFLIFYMFYQWFVTSMTILFFLDTLYHRCIN